MLLDMFHIVLLVLLSFCFFLHHSCALVAPAAFTLLLLSLCWFYLVSGCFPFRLIRRLPPPGRPALGSSLVNEHFRLRFLVRLHYVHQDLNIYITTNSLHSLILHGPCPEILGPCLPITGSPKNPQHLLDRRLRTRKENSQFQMSITSNACPKTLSNMI